METIRHHLLEHKLQIWLHLGFLFLLVGKTSTEDCPKVWLTIWKHHAINQAMIPNRSRAPFSWKNTVIIIPSRRIVRRICPEPLFQLEKEGKKRNPVLPEKEACSLSTVLYLCEQWRRLDPLNWRTFIAAGIFFSNSTGSVRRAARDRC